MCFEDELVDKIKLNFDSTLFYIQRYYDLYKLEEQPWVKQQIKMIILNLVINLYKVEIDNSNK